MSAATYYYPTKEISDLRFLLTAAERQFGTNRLFVIPEDAGTKEITYSAFYRAVEAFGSYLFGMLSGSKTGNASGVKSPMTAMIVADNSFEWACAFFTVVSGLGKVVPADVTLSGEELALIAAKAGVTHILYQGKYEEKTHEVQNKTSCAAICLDSLSDMCKAGRERDEDCVDFVRLNVNGNDGAVVLCPDSGSKPFVLTHDDLCSDTRAVGGMLLTDGKDVFASPLAWSSQYSLAVSLLFPMLRGSAVILSRGMRYLTRELNEYKATVLCCTPSLSTAIYRRIQANISAKGTKKFKNAKFLAGISGNLVGLKKRIFSELHDSFGGSLRFILNCGDCDPSVADGLFGYGIPVIRSFGLCGGLPPVAMCREDALRSGSSGISVPGVITDIYDARTDGCGEIRFKAEGAFEKSSPDGRKALLRGQWVYTGFVGHTDFEGFLFVNGKKAHIIDLPGARIIPENAEKILESSKFVKRAALLSIRNENSGDCDLVAVLSPDTDALRLEYGPRYTAGQTDAEMTAAIALADAAGPEQQKIKCFVIYPSLSTADKNDGQRRADLAEKIYGEYLRKLAKAN